VAQQLLGAHPPRKVADRAMFGGDFGAGHWKVLREGGGGGGGRCLSALRTPRPPRAAPRPPPRAPD
jgi:hypothetical protein